MPVYEYECLKCGTHFDEIQKFSDPPIKKHSGCGGKVHRVPAAPAFQFKGSGWYVTDYAKRDSRASGEGKKKSAEAKAESKSGSGEGGSAKERESSPKESSKPAETKAKG